MPRFRDLPRVPGVLLPTWRAICISLPLHEFRYAARLPTYFSYCLFSSTWEETGISAVNDVFATFHHAAVNYAEASATAHRGFRGFAAIQNMAFSCPRALYKQRSNMPLNNISPFTSPFCVLHKNNRCCRHLQVLARHNDARTACLIAKCAIQYRVI